MINSVTLARLATAGLALKTQSYWLVFLLRVPGQIQHRLARLLGLMDSGLDMSVFRGFEPDIVVAELVKLGHLDKRLLGTAWCNRDKQSRLNIIQKMSGKGCAADMC